MGSPTELEVMPQIKGFYMTENLFDFHCIAEENNMLSFQVYICFELHFDGKLILISLWNFEKFNEIQIKFEYNFQWFIKIFWTIFILQKC